jgi:hypothetical protein
MTATVEAGMHDLDLQQPLAQRGQRLAIDPLWPDRATGRRRARDQRQRLAPRGPSASLRDLLLGVTVDPPRRDAWRAAAARSSKNVAGYDLPKLMAGALRHAGRRQPRPPFRPASALPRAEPRRSRRQSGRVRRRNASSDDGCSAATCRWRALDLHRGRVPSRNGDCPAGGVAPKDSNQRAHGGSASWPRRAACPTPVRGRTGAESAVGDVESARGMQDHLPGRAVPRDAVVAEVFRARTADRAWSLMASVPPAPASLATRRPERAGPGKPSVAPHPCELQLLGGSLVRLKAPAEVSGTAGAWHQT